MAGKAQTGITYSPTPCDEYADDRIKLLIHDCGDSAYLVYRFIIGNGHKVYGYYFDYSNRNKLILFASDICKKDVAYVERVINSAISQGLFDEELASTYNILTSATMQDDYLNATKARRKKGTEVIMYNEYLLIAIDHEKEPNVFIAPMNNPNIPEKKIIPPENNSILPGNNDEIGKKPRKRANKIVASEKLAEQQSAYEKIHKTGGEIHKFVLEQKPSFIEPYIDLWNVWALKYKKPKVEVITDARKKHLAARLAEKKFDFIEILARASKSNFIMSGTFFTFDWITDSKNNYVKVLEGNYDNKDMPPVQQVAGPASSNTMDDKLEQMINKKNNGK